MRRFRKAAIVCPPSFTMLIDAGPVHTLFDIVKSEYPDARLEIVTDQKRWEHINQVSEDYVGREREFTWGDFYPNDVLLGEVTDVLLEDGEIEACIATCVGCGCTDEEACPPGCHWLHVNYRTGRGVCSECPGALELFLAAEFEENSSTC